MQWPKRSFQTQAGPQELPPIPGSCSPLGPRSHLATRAGATPQSPPSPTASSWSAVSRGSSAPGLAHTTSPTNSAWGSLQGGFTSGLAALGHPPGSSLPPPPFHAWHLTGNCRFQPLLLWSLHPGCRSCSLPPPRKAISSTIPFLHGIFSLPLLVGLPPPVPEHVYFRPSPTYTPMSLPDFGRRLASGRERQRSLFPVFVKSGALIWASVISSRGCPGWG